MYQHVFCRLRNYLEYIMKKQNLEIGSKVAGFTVEDIVEIAEINSVAYVLKHSGCGASCIHLYNDDKNNLFSVAFKTPVFDDTGVAHILEHSVLAGSDKYPLKDPFKEMLKSSMQTFLNAITYPDRTVYPVASQVETDFFNLVDVYCDAVFNPLLKENTFRQEGWHFDIEKEGDPLSIKGIVYNEMKGVFSDFHSNVARKMLSGLFPDTTYYYESGGDPKAIPDLSYEEFKDFHARYYHPSNGYMVLYGDIPTEKTLSFVNERFLQNFSFETVNSEVSGQTPWKTPQEMYMKVPSSKEDDGSATVLVNWMWQGVLDGEEGLLCDIITRYLFNGESAPLKRALLDSGLGEDLDDMCGYDNDLFCAAFSAGLAKTKPEHAEKILAIVENTIQKIVDEGPDPDLLEGTVRRIEFSLREIKKGGHFPYPLRLAEGIHRSWLYGGDPMTHIAFEKPLEAIKKKILSEPRYFEKKLESLTLKNSHRLLMVAEASAELGEKLGKQTEEHSKELSKQFGEDDFARFHKQTLELIEEQKREHTEEELSCIPQLDKKDIPEKNEITPLEVSTVAGRPLYVSPLFTAGITYLDISFDLHALSDELLDFFPLYTKYLIRAGAGGMSTLDMAKRINLVTGGVSNSDCIMNRFNGDDIVAYTTFHGKALASSTEDMVALFRDIFVEPDFSDKRLLKDLVFEGVNSLSSSITRSGHVYAALNGSARLLKTKAIEERMDGITQYRFLKKLSQEEKYDWIFKQFEKIHALLINKETAFVAMTAENASDYTASVGALLDELPSFPPEVAPFALAPERIAPFAVEVNSSVNYVTQSWKLKHFTAKDCGELYLMSRLLSTGFLWDKVRVEGGAYGGMALFGTSQPIFTFGSYRDPNLGLTLDNYTLALDHILNELTQADVDKAVCGAVGKLDVPKSPHPKGYGEAIAYVVGNTVERRQELRDTLLSCTLEGIRKQAQFLKDTIAESQIAIIASKAGIDDAIEAGYDLRREEL